MDRGILRAGWFVVEASEAELVHAGIYEWEIANIGIYVGKSKNLTSRLREYPNNVRKLLAGAPYRLSNPGGFRIIHRSLADAHQQQISVKFRVLETCECDSLNERERYWIAHRRASAAAGGLCVLNSN
jgi:hypothetical protein